MTDRFVDFWRGFSERLAAAGVPAWRVSLHMMTLHPEIRAAAYFYWAEDGRVEREEYAHRTANSGQYLHSPIRVLVEGRAAEVRHRLCDLAPPYPYPVFEELAAKGATDYVLIGLPLVTGRQAAIGLVSTAPTASMPNRASFASWSA
ncbi:MAG TPA: hypothetical protein VEH84_05450, partial [Alphaproteobacteria bacterium]|nr:hypothetical protein [Alphaproteobacteria bacterium]